ncbi:MAG: CHAT domain-containing protein [Xenococcaceae cyanobacterium]
MPVEATNPESDDEQRIEELIELLGTSKDESTRWQAAESLGKIGTGNPKAIEGLIELLGTSKDESTRREAAESLGKIGTGNLKAIEGLIELLRTSKDVLIRREAAESLEKIGTGNPIAIEGLRELLHTSQSEYTHWLVSQILGKIDSSTDWQAQGVEDNLLLFLEVTRVTETVDQYFSLNNHKKTKFCYHRIIACLDRMQEGRDILTRRSLLKSYLEIYKRIISFSLKTGDFNSTFFYTEIFRNRYLVERISQQNMPLPETVTPELSAQIEQAKLTERKTLQKYTDGINRNLDEQQLEQLDSNWGKAKKALENLYAQVAAIEPEFIAKTNVSAISFREVQTSLPLDTAILEFFFTENRLITMLILPGAESPIIPESLTLELKQDSLENLAQAWVSDITALKKKSKKNGGIEATIQEIPYRINRISDLLKFRNLLDYIPPKIQHILIVPNNYLHLFPIHALWVNDHQRLIERFSVSYFPNIQVWKICQKRQRDCKSLISIENPTQDKDLIFAKAEVASISQCPKFLQYQVLKGKQATKAEVLRLAESNHCLHFSGHAEYNLENPLESYLMLSEEDYNNLTLNTIFADMQMPQADLVTLSACCTGVVDAFQPTEEHLGLSTGFLLAGAKAVIGSQWKVNSISTAFIFDKFYQQLETTDNKAVALQNAQNWLRHSTADELRERAKTWNLSTIEPKEKFRLERALKRLKDTPFENPYYWAAFILTGC